MTSLRSFSECILSGALDLDRLQKLPDKEVIAKLDVVKGIGIWTADMFLIFHLHRPDVLPVGDLELRRVVAKVYGLPTAPTPAARASPSRGGHTGSSASSTSGSWQERAPGL